MKILVVDDDSTSRLVTLMALRNLGHQTHTARDGADAWEQFRSLRPEAVISDWLMPGLSGLELCRNIRADATSYTYFMMVTGQGARDQMLEGMAAGADDYLVKPLDPDDLEARLIAADRVTSLHRRLAAQQIELEGLNDELTGIARRDPLTGLRNRRALDEEIDALEARALRYGHGYCMALLDLDRFKSYNDTYGHQAGDQVLRTVAAQIRAQAREGDAIYRYGGDEVLCILPEQSLSTGTAAVERMRMTVELLAVPHGLNPLGVLTLSAGTAVLDANRARSAGEVLKEADEALYRAKELGGNRVETMLSLPA
jgi:two-component system chemotaxis response regulator CheY